MDIIGSLGSVLSVAQTLGDALQRYEQLKEKLSVFGYEDELTNLLRTVKTLTAVLRDAETKQELSHQAQEYIERVKNAIFEADDLVDEFVTLAQQQRLVDADGSFREKVSHFFSRSNPICVSYWMSKGIKDVKKKLDAIAYNKQFELNIDPEPIRKRRPESCSYVNKVEIIGREGDLAHIVGKLLVPNDQRDVSVISIVGMGGLGKTALAQLVYNDPRVTRAFQLKLWACVSDEGQKRLDVKDILGKILGCSQQGSTLESVQSELRDRLAGKKYLLILDDVWTEKRDQWCELVKYLSEEKRGSWIVVTTRSQKTAAITGGPMHKLSGLSEEGSWHLFERVANPPDELVMVGKKIVDGCSGVPLAIKVVGSLLYGQDKKKWLSIQENGLANIRDGDNMMSILKLSFHHLEFQLKNCFQYCALFPKDHVIEKEMLISLWMAQGYIVPLDRWQSIEDASEEYFAILLKRCFFQDIEKNEFGEIKSCKMHDLMHDLAQHVSQKEIYASNTISGNLDSNIRHLSIFNNSEFERYYSLGETHLRSLLLYHCMYFVKLEVDALVRKYRCLRVLDLSGREIKCLPDSIGELLHLRYIDLSENELEALPNSVTKLCNLQTLILSHCGILRELPKDLSRLVELRFLDIDNCSGLKRMPRSMGKLTSLHTLKGDFIVGGGERCTSWKQWLHELDELKTLINLKGQLLIHMQCPENAKHDVNEDDNMREGLYLRSMEHLNHIGLRFCDDDCYDEEDSERMEEEKGIRMRVMEDLQPHSNLKSLEVEGYDDVKMPSWATATLLPHLVKLSLESCQQLEYLPCLGNLCHLKSLNLACLPNLEYIIEEEGSARLASTSTSTSARKLSHFPSLELLKLIALPKFQGWRRVGVDMEGSSNMSSSNKQHLSQLKNLCISSCPELMLILSCPVLDKLHLIRFNQRLQIQWCTKTDEKLREAAIQTPEIAGANIIVPKLRTLHTDKVAWLDSMPMECVSSVQYLGIYGDDEMEDLPNWMQYLSALQTLRIERCRNLRAMPNWMPKLTSLRALLFSQCSERLKKKCQNDPPGEDWPYIKHIPHINLGYGPIQYELRT